MTTKQMNKLKVIKCYSTIGLMAYIPSIDDTLLVKIACDTLEDGTRKIYVENARNLNVIKGVHPLFLTKERVENLFDDNNVQEFRNFANLFGLEI